MNTVEIILLAVGLGLDTTAISFAAASSGYTKDSRAIFRLSFHFGFFQFLMPVLGWFLGRSLLSSISSYDHWIAFVLLALVGIRMIRSGLKPSELSSKTDPTRGYTLIMLSIATSIDAFAVGLSFAVLEVSIWYPSALIGIVTVVLSLTAIKLGHRLGAVFGQRMEIFGGALLIFLGFRILFSHLLG